MGSNFLITFARVILDLSYKTMIKLFVPGRLCLFGEHTDWAGHYRTMNADIEPGAAIVTGIEQGIYAEVEKSSMFEVKCSFLNESGENADFSCRMDEQELKRVARSRAPFLKCPLSVAMVKEP